MKRLPVFRQSLSGLRWQIFWFGAGLGLYGGAITFLFPAFEDFIDEVAANYPPEFIAFFGGADMSSPAGFVTLEYQSFSVLILSVYAVIASTGLLAGEEGRGTLESLLAEPISRTRLIVEKGGSFIAATLAIGAVICVGWLPSLLFVDFHGELTFPMLAGATFGSLPIVLLFGALGFWLGAVAPSRGIAAGFLAALAVASYLVSSIAQAVEPIRQARFFSAYYYSDTARWLTDGPVWWHQVMLLVASIVVAVLAVRTFEGREIGRGSWQWGAFLRRGRAR